jgi:Sulfatase
VPPETDLPPVNPIGTPEARKGPKGQPLPALDFTRPWDSLSDDEHRLFCRMAEVYAGFLTHADYQIGRLLAYLEETEQLENTIIVLVSGNGASGEGGPNGSLNENKFINQIPDDIETNLAMIDELGGPKTYNHYPNGWAMAFNTPFKVGKRYAAAVTRPSSRGPRRSSPRARSATSTTTRSTSSRRSSTAWGSSRPKRSRATCRAVSTGSACATASTTPTLTAPQDAVLLFNARFAGDLARRLEGRQHAPDGRRLEQLQSRHLGALPRGHRPRGAARPRRRAPGQTARTDQPVVLRSGRAKGTFPLDDRSPIEIITTPRPQITSPRNRCRYFLGVAEVPEALAVNARSRDYIIGVLLDIPAPGASGVLFAHGSHFGGHTLYIKDNRLHYVYNFVGMIEQKIDATEDVPVGENLMFPHRSSRMARTRRASQPGSCRSTTAIRRSVSTGSRPSPRRSASPALG